jgi:hypothetical protein
MLKFFEIEGRFPEFIEEFPQPAVEYVAGLVKVPAGELANWREAVVDERGPPRQLRTPEATGGFLAPGV